MAGRDWLAWHLPYDDPGSSLSRRLCSVQGLLRDVLDGAPPGRVSVVSICAGQGHDVFGVLVDHPRRLDVRALLVERDPRNVAIARHRAQELGVDVDVREADAGTSDAYRDHVPAHLVLACGVFGNISDDDVRGTIAHLPALCAPGATVLWTRHRNPPDLTGPIRGWFASAGFTEVAFDAPDDTAYGVGAHRLDADPLPFRSERLFSFVGFDRL